MLAMRILAIGDIHGCSIAFDSLVAAVDLQPKDRLVTLGDYYETDTHLFVHANIDPDIALAFQLEHILLWEPFENSMPHYSGKTLVCGHTTQKSGVPLNHTHAICIDTWAYGKGWLTCLDVMSGRVWQANQKAEVRTAWIDEFAP